jgi:hypothetical protein
LKNNNKKFHRGELLQQVVASAGMSITNLVRKAGYSRSSYYNHINDPELPIDILLNYGKILHVDLSIYFPELLENFVKEPSNFYLTETPPQTLEEAAKYIDEWKFRYYELLEKHQTLLEKYLKLNG